MPLPSPSSVRRPFPPLFVRAASHVQPPSVRFCARGEVRAAERDPHREARTLLALTDGLTAHTLVGHHTPADAETALEAHLAHLFGS
ncbi:TetR family transcriptional regulator C-terminal domain-containing protein [Saccharopolyspora sp. NPDC050642]|uniref:TetR family transcriptional regulator C-terminal domain-containing protein n=1 Tax=Saccharopolyspora sp. NPDC050642 TaxID=3157099 RepID=UPI0033C94BA7